MFYYDASCPVLNDTLRPTHLPFDTPEISALLADNVGGLPPQLVLYSKEEILASDSVRWIKKSRAAGVDITEHAASGEMHTFAVGWPVSGRKTQDQCDALMLNYILEHAKSA
jgi:acetyl esterase/lipase